MDCLQTWLNAVSNFLWGGPVLLVLLFGTHLFLTIRLRFIQRYVGRGIRLSLGGKKKGSGEISHFGALTTALAATIGVGNIVGVSTAVLAGGPGAVLWMWLTGVFGIATKYSEALLSVRYRVKMPNGQMAGGPMYALERGLGQRWLGLIFAGFTAVAAFGIGNMVQSDSLANQVSDALNLARVHVLNGTLLGVPYIRWATGAITAGLVALVILGGVRWIARVCERLVPFMALFYVAGCAVLLVLRADTLPATLALIVKSAFTGQAAVGGFVGVTMKEAIRYGLARGLFSNEAGLGSAPIVAAAAQTPNPVRQALVSSTGPFWDTVVVCAMTGLVIVNGGQWTHGHATATQLVTATFSRVPYFGSILLTVGMLTFVFSTLLGWSYYGEKAYEYLFGSRVIRYYRWAWVAFVMVGAVIKLKMVWTFADIANACMAVPNLLSLLLLSGVIVAQTRKYLWNGALDAEAPEEDNGTRGA